jgi:cephalosporin-C deacetylase
VAHVDLPLDQLRRFAPDVAEPDDFDTFWERTLAEARAAAGDVEVVPVETGLTHVDVFDVTFPGFGGHPIKAWYARPAGAMGQLPCIVEIAGYGGGRGLPIEHTVWPSAGYAYMILDTRGQGSSWGAGGDTPDPVGSTAATPGYMTRGILDPKDYYFRRVITDAVLAVDTAQVLPGVDASRVAFKGASQGGGVTLGVAGLVPDLIAVMPDVPFLCYFERAVSMADTMPYPEIRQYLSVHRDVTEQVFRTLSYVDGVNFSKRATAPALWSIALMDDICPPSTCFAAYNRYGERSGAVPKDVTVYPYNGHEGGGAHQLALQLAFMSEVLG